MVLIMRPDHDADADADADIDMDMDMDADADAGDLSTAVRRLSAATGSAC
ncbi:hypothetical protein ABH926_000788 [Catenulispora sp. GP43]